MQYESFKSVISLQLWPWLALFVLRDWARTSKMQLSQRLMIWARTISSTSTFPWPFTACRPDFLPPFLSLSPAVLSDNIKAKKTQKIYKICSTWFSQQTPGGNTCSTVSSTWQTACDGFFLVFLHGCGWTPMTPDGLEYWCWTKRLPERLKLIWLKTHD